MQNPALNDNQRATLTLWYVLSASNLGYQKLMVAYGDAKTALDAPKTDWQKLGIHINHIKRRDDDVVSSEVLRVIARYDDGEFGIVCLGDDDYPPLLAQIFDPPAVLFYQGDVKVLSLPQICIVGSRKPTPRAKTIARVLATRMTQANLVVTSGLAEGIDTAAHEGALLYGRTIGVMGTGIDVVYPKYNRDLMLKIRQNGCLVSEFLLGAGALKHHFPRRNRIVAGLSKAALVIEAKQKSGSLITARLTNEMGRQVFVLPSDLDNENAKGGLDLIRDGATLVYHPNHILEDLSLPLLPDFRATNAPSDDIETADLTLNTAQNPTQTLLNNPPSAPIAIPPHLGALYDALAQPQSFDALLLTLNVDAPALSAMLTELELLDGVSQVGGLYQRVCTC